MSNNKITLKNGKVLEAMTLTNRNYMEIVRWLDSKGYTCVECHVNKNLVVDTDEGEVNVVLGDTVIILPNKAVKVFSKKGLENYLEENS